MKFGGKEIKAIAIKGPAPAVRLVMLFAGVPIGQQEAPLLLVRALVRELQAACDEAEGVQRGQQ